MRDKARAASSHRRRRGPLRSPGAGPYSPPLTAEPKLGSAIHFATGSERST